MIELFITSENFFSVYLKDLNVPLAYIILTTATLIICYKKHIPVLRTIFIGVFSVAGVASLLDAIYDYQIKIFVYQNMSLTEGLLFLLFPIPFYALSFFMYKYGEIKRIIYILIPIYWEITFTYMNTNIELTKNIVFTPIIRYAYVAVFVYILLGLKKEPKKT